MRKHVSFPWSWLQALGRLLDSQTSTRAPEFIEISLHRTELRVGNTSFVLDARSRLITRNGNEFARFDNIQTIDLTHAREDEDSPERWSIQLNTGLISSKTVLVTTDDADASIVGARLSEITGKRVRSL